MNEETKINEQKGLADFNDLLDIGVIRREVEIGKHIFLMKTLSFLEFSKITSNIKDGDLNSQLSFLVESIETIDGVKLPTEKKKDLLQKMQMALVNKLMSSYTDLMNDQAKMIDEVKKNS